MDEKKGNLQNHLPLDEEFDDFIIIGVSSEHDGSYVWGEFWKLAVHHQRGNLRKKDNAR